MTLADAKIGQRIRIKEVRGEGPLRKRLLEMGLIPGTEVQMKEPAPMGDPLLIHLRNYDLTLRVREAENIIVEGDMLEGAALAEEGTSITAPTSTTTPTAAPAPTATPQHSQPKYQRRRQRRHRHQLGVTPTETPTETPTGDEK